jgi:hypothetical protein
MELSGSGNSVKIVITIYNPGIEKNGREARIELGIMRKTFFLIM